MNQRTTRYALVISIVISLLLISFSLSPIRSHAPTSVETISTSAPKVTITVNGQTIFAEVVKKQEALERGLSGRDALASGTGMWFDFGYSDRWGIWMKDMKFPIDIVWIDKNLSVISIKESVAPETFPEAFYPARDAMYVLEIPSGAVEKYHLEVGNHVLPR